MSSLPSNARLQRCIPLPGVETQKSKRELPLTAARTCPWLPESLSASCSAGSCQHTRGDIACDPVLWLNSSQPLPPPKNGFGDEWSLSLGPALRKPHGRATIAIHRDAHFGCLSQTCLAMLIRGEVVTSQKIIVRYIG